MEYIIYINNLLFRHRPLPLHGSLFLYQRNCKKHHIQQIFFYLDSYHCMVLWFYIRGIAKKHRIQQIFFYLDSYHCTVCVFILEKLQKTSHTANILLFRLLPLHGTVVLHQRNCKNHRIQQIVFYLDLLLHGTVILYQRNCIQ